jgi:hypothetical protein
MAYIFGDGFDSYPTTATGSHIACGGWTALSSSSAQMSSSNTRFSYGKSFNANGQYLWKKFDNITSNTVYVSFAYYHTETISLSPSASYYAYFTLIDVDTEQVTVVFRGNGSIDVLRGGTNGTVIATFYDAFVNQNWNHWQFKVVIDSSVGAIYIRKDNDPTNTFSQENINTQNTASPYADSVYLGNVHGYLFGVPEFIDDFIIFDNSGAAPNDWLGDVRSFRLLPTADSTINFTPLDETNYQMINDTDQDDDVSYNYSNVVDDIDTFDIETLPVVPSSIHVVTLKVVARKDNTSARSAAGILDSGGTIDYTDTKLLPSSYTGLIKSYTTDPNTGNAWNMTGVNAIKIGYKVIS